MVVGKQCDYLHKTALVLSVRLFCYFRRSKE